MALMFITVTSKRQVTFPARVLEALGAKPGDCLELVESPDGYVLRVRRIDHTRLAPLRGKLRLAPELTTALNPRARSSINGQVC